MKKLILKSAMAFLSGIAPSAFAQNAPVQPKFDEIKFANKTAKIVFPVNSQYVLDSNWPKQLGGVNTFLEESYSANCKSLAHGALTDSFEHPAHMSEIPELDQPILSYVGEAFSSASCAKSVVSKNDSGFLQARGSIELTLSKTQGFESSDRRFYRITMPWKKSTSWGGGSSDAKLYKSACEVRSESAGSTVLVSCSAPEMAVACCGNASLTGTMDAIVFAYSKNKLNSKVITAASPLEVIAKGNVYLAKKAKLLAGDLAFSICTPPNWEYDPIMAYQSTCYTLEQSFVPADATIQYCSGSASADTKVWVLLKHDAEKKRDYISVSVQSPRSNSGYGDYVTTVSKNNSKTVLKSDAGALFTLDGKSATLTEGNKLDKDLPPGAIALSCK